MTAPANTSEQVVIDAPVDPMQNMALMKELRSLDCASFGLTPAASKA